ncbi:DUF397 domain-containing protein [Actinomadura sp. NPDC047616]|uniref:DUF397 domain-containing protein n=1 Tax=Actinomadura sp. NPDC047616 TaxID=3155914 RepID=UPI0033EE2ADB
MTNHYTGWRKSRHSEPNGDCIEVARATNGTIGIRDSKAPDGPILELNAVQWARLLADVRDASST